MVPCEPHPTTPPEFSQHMTRFTPSDFQEIVSQRPAVQDFTFLQLDMKHVPDDKYYLQ